MPAAKSEEHGRVLSLHFRKSWLRGAFVRPARREDVVTRHETDTNRLQPPMGALERTLIDEFLSSRGLDQETLGRLPEVPRHALLAEASTYASARLTEIESRSHFVHELHGTQDTGGCPVK
jgi:hypothetical protein